MKLITKIAFLLGACLLVLSACKKEEEIIKPAIGVKSADWQTVPSSGGTISLNDISIEFPAGAFGKESKVAITPVPKGKVDEADGRELSEFYQIVFPSEGTQKPFTIKINYSGDIKRVAVLAQSPKRERYTGKKGLHAALLSSVKDDGFVSAEIPDVSQAEGEQPFFTVGLVDASLSAAPATKAGNILYYTVDWCVPLKEQAKYDKYREDILEIIRTEIGTAARIFGQLGIEPSPESVKYVITPVSGGNWGQHCSDQYVKTNGTVEIDINQFYKLVSKGKPYDSDLYGQLQQTIAHETFHWIHEAVYDPRCATVINIVQGNEWSMLSEAVATWLEKFTGNKRISENCPTFSESLIKAFFCAGDDFQSTGYGMGLFIEWLSKKSSDKQIVKILEYQRDNGGWTSSASLRAAFDKVLKDNKLEFFKPADNWNKFIWEVIQNKFDDRVESSKARNSFGLEYRAKVEHATNTFTNAEIYNFGLGMQQVVLNQSMKDKMSGNPGLSLAFTQKEDKVKTWVCDSKWNIIGLVEKNKPFAVDGKTALAENVCCYLLHERLEQDTKPDIIKGNILAEIVPWPTFVSIAVENGYLQDYYDWSNDEITVTLTSNGYLVKADYPGGAHLEFKIGWVNNRFADIANVYLKVDYDSSKGLSAGLIKLDYSQGSSIEKSLRWKGTYQGKEIIVSCRLK